MSRKRKKKRNKTAREKKTQETAAAEAITVAWMLSMLATIGAEVAAIVVFVWTVVASMNDESIVLRLPGILLYIALVTGIVCLILIPIAQKVRRKPAPSGITICALVVGVAPMVTVLVLSLILNATS